MDDLTISVTIADRPYRLTIKRDEEERIRLAASEINKTIKFYSDNYAFQDKQDLLAMVALEKTSDALQQKHELQNSGSNIKNELTDIDKVLSDSLKEI